MKQEFRDEHTLKLQGKDYLPVAPRVVLFRADHPDHSILTKVITVGEDTYVYAEIHAPCGNEGLTRAIATAHKRVRPDGKGPAAKWPLETAETGAIGRALALCGYGTLAGDLDEGDQLADSPVAGGASEINVATAASAASDSDSDVSRLLAKIKKATKKQLGTIQQPGALRKEVRERAASLPQGDATRLALVEAVKAREAELG